MKKGLSVLLIVAALFGFYGGATSLNDILASKDYWEEVGEKSTADMNKLEDGLNQLKDNEQAYLDGKEELAEGEAKLADAEVQLAEGRATLAKGEADYAAAPKKLADAEDQLAEGKASLNKLATALTGVNTIISGYDTQWKPGYDKLKSGREQITAGLSTAQLAGKPATAVLKGMAPLSGDAAAFSAAVDAVAGDDGKAQNYDGYIAYTTNCKILKTGIDNIEAAYAAGKGAGAQVYAGLSALPAGWWTVPAYASSAEEKIVGVLGTNTIKGMPVSTLISKWDTDLGIGKTGSEVIKSALDTADATTLSLIRNTDKVKELRYGLGEMATALDQGKIKDLADAQDQMADGIRTIATGVLGNKTLKAGVKKAMGKSAITLLRVYSSSPSPINTKSADFARFEKQMDTTPGLIMVLQKARVFLGKTRANGIKTYNAGLKKYKQGLADYAAAPGKLADGRRQLAEGEAQFADGVKQLEDGKKQLAQYEDGEQQIRDGLATLMATEPDPGLTSILERIGDDDFDNGDAHLEIEEGLNAVEVGRGYQADSGELITKEITNRAVGTAAGLAAGALAVLAAILSFLKKNKGAGISALIAAAAGLLGCFVGMGAGEYYSDIAGSTVGNLPFIAAGVLAAVAIVFAVIHFQAKPEAKAEAK